MMFWYGSGMGAWGYAVTALSMVAFWALVILAIIGLVQYLSRGTGPSRARSAPEETLADRFARGEIDEQDYRQRLDILHAVSRPSPHD